MDPNTAILWIHGDDRAAEVLQALARWIGRGGPLPETNLNDEAVERLRREGLGDLALAVRDAITTGDACGLAGFDVDAPPGRA